MLDIRCVGDGYYDKPWEEVMIKNRVKTEGIYVLCKEDYNYSILYHALLQKRERDGAKYNQMLRELFDESNKEKWIGNLAQFLSKGYQAKRQFFLDSPGLYLFLYHFRDK